MKVHRFLMGLDPKIKTMVNFLNPKTFEEAYDLAKREESNLEIKKTFVNYNLLDEKDKEIHRKNHSVEHQAQKTSNKKYNHGYKDGNHSSFEKRPFGNKCFKKKNF